MKAFAGIIIVLVIGTGVACAHQGVHRRATKTDLTRIADSLSVHPDTLGHVSEGVAEGVDRHEQNHGIAQLAFEHLHNKLVHFPIVLGIVAFVIALIDKKSCRYEDIIFGMVVGGGLFSVIAVITGLFQSQHFIGTDQEWLVQYHKVAGILLLMLYVLWAALLRLKDLKKYSWVVGFVASVLILVTGIIGGVIAH
jgi:uncharacterized membrane protein